LALLLTLPANKRTAKKNLLLTRALAYFGLSSMTNKKLFITLSPGVIFTNMVMVVPVDSIPFNWLHADAYTIRRE
jgi:hypothetical protein